MEPLLEALNDRDHPDRVRDAAATIRGSLKNNPENKARLLAAGGIDILVELLQYNDSTTVEHAVTALLNMALTDGVEPLITAAGGIEAISAVLRQGSLVARENAAAAVFVMSGPSDNKAMVRDAGAIEPLVSLLSQAGLRGRKDAALALFNLSLDESCVDSIVDAGAVHALLKVLRDPNMHRGMDDKAMAVIANLCKFDVGRQAVQDARGIPVLLAVVEWGSSRAKEDAAVSMYLLALHSVNAFQMILEEDAVPALTALSKSGTSRAKAKVRGGRGAGNGGSGAEASGMRGRLRFGWVACGAVLCGDVPELWQHASGRGIGRSPAPTLHFFLHLPTYPHLSCTPPSFRLLPSLVSPSILPRCFH